MHMKMTILDVTVAVGGLKARHGALGGAGSGL